MKTRSYVTALCAALIAAGCAATPKSVSTAYILVFNGLKMQEYSLVDEQIAEFRGYEHHRQLSYSMRHVQVWYETEESSTQLNQYLLEMLDRLNIKARVIFSGNQFQIQKIGLQRK